MGKTPVHAQLGDDRWQPEYSGWGKTFFFA
jgi:hypothetical protein